MLCIGLALIVLIGANWNEIPRAVRMGGLLLLTAGTQLAALRRYSQVGEGLATGLFFLGNIFYGASIILIAQIYHLGEYMPDGVFWWALGCLPVALLTRNPWLMLQTLFLAFIWAALEISHGVYPAFAGIFIFGGMYILYTGRQSLLLFLAVIASLGGFLEYSLCELWSQPGYFRLEAEHLIVTVSLFIFGYGTSLQLGQHASVKAKDYGAVLGLWTLRFALVFLLVMTFEDPWKELLRANWEHLGSMALISGSLVLGAVYFAYRAQKMFPFSAIVLCSMLMLPPLVASDTILLAGELQLISNFVLVLSGIWLVIRGIQSGISHYFFLGVSSIIAVLFFRYIDLIGDYIGASILFMVFAAVLLGAAKYWKVHNQRRLAYEN